MHGIIRIAVERFRFKYRKKIQNRLHLNPTTRAIIIGL